MTTSLLGYVLKRWSWKSFAVGAGAVVVGSTVARPVLVSAVKTGMDIADAGVTTYNRAKAEAISLRNDATKLRVAETDVETGNLHALLAGIQSELQNLRADVAASKAAAAKKPV